LECQQILTLNIIVNGRNMSENEALYLDLESVNSLLPDNLKIDTGNIVERSAYRTVSGSPLPIINSKLYPDNYYWYSSITKYFKEIGAEYICFTAGLRGIIILPIDMVLQYNKFSGWKGESKKRRRYHVCIKHTEDDNMHLWNFNNPDVNFDIQSYFYPVK